MENRTNQPFTEALGTMLRERSGDRMGRFPLAPFIAQVGDKTGLNYEYIRLMLRDQRTLRTDVIEAAAEALGAPPHTSSSTGSSASRRRWSATRL